MRWLGFALYVVPAPTVAGLFLIAVLSTGMGTPLNIISAVCVGFLLAIPFSVFVGRLIGAAIK